MPFLDRYWWLRLILTLLGLVIAVPILLLMASGFLLIQQSGGLGEFFWQGAITGFFLLLFLIMLLFGLVNETRAARRHSIARREAMSGRADEIPLSTIHADASLAPDLTQGPLVLYWRPTYSRRMVLASLDIIILFVGAVMAYMAYASIATPILASGPPIVGLPFQAAMVAIFLPLLLAFVVVALAGQIITLDEALGHPSGVIFSAEGTQERTYWRRRRLVRWEDARLLEVRLVQNQFRQYILYGADGTFARWMDYLPAGAVGASSLVKTSWYMPDSGSNEEMSRRLREALALVAARTGQTPHTFAGSLQERTPTTRPQLRLGGLLLTVALVIVFLVPAAALFLGFLSIPLLSGLYFLTQQPMRSPALDMLCGGALALGGALFLGWIPVDIVWRLIPHRAPSVAEPVTLPDELFPTPTRVYSLVIRQTWPGAVLSFTIPLLLSIGGALALTGALAQPSPDLHGFDLYAVTGAVLSGLIGVITLIVRIGLGARSVTTIQATAQGLRAQHPRHTLDLPWETIETLKLSKASDRPRVYSVSGDTGKIAMAWRADTLRVNDLDGAVPLSAAELAALIERRTGIALNEETE